MSTEQRATTANNFRIKEWFPELSDNEFEKLKIYFDELLRTNKTLNLVSPKTIVFADIIHFADSIIASKIIMKAAGELTEIYDLGSGNGFPGLVFACLYPKVSVIMVDSDERKCEFIKHTASKMSLSNVSVKKSTIESLPDASIKFCISRGLANISKSILMTRKCVAAGGSYFHLKGENWSVEVKEIPTQLCSIWSPSLVDEYKLPQSPYKFAIIKTEKIS